ncbi:transcription factor HHO5-like isoform X1 [Rhododendron vialii]|uniref:transcription factor HHO5-like isoform X1 n=1 Tax=Rhododendron vialii TaxID=182163 RepID=UPI00265E7FD5|nr:transcription factor HHO5-like isoform X1 [Rhododendron vialii]
MCEREREREMGMNSTELTLDLSSIHGTPKPIFELLKEPSMISGISQKPSNIGSYLETLEHELKKIDGFKRELPLSICLLTDAIERLKEERMQSERSSNEVIEPVTEELIQLMGNSDENGRPEQVSSDSRDKRNWMSSAKLWTAGSAAKCENCKSRDKTGDGSATKTPSQPCNLKNRGGAFVPFEVTSAKVGLLEQGQLLLKPVGGIGSTNLDLEGSSKHSDSSSVTEQVKTYTTTKLKQHQQQQQHFKQQKKHRRCWSPELHRRFVDALGLLGGAQAATPKHIKELMQVDSLTNDEVKSHLQDPHSETTRFSKYDVKRTIVVPK